MIQKAMLVISAPSMLAAAPAQRLERDLVDEQREQSAARRRRPAAPATNGSFSCSTAASATIAAQLA